MATELATAYINLVPSARGIQGSIAKELGAPLQSVARNAGAQASSTFGGSFTSGVKSVASAVTGALGSVGRAIGETISGVATVGGLLGATLGSAALASGYTRLTTMENATKSLTISLGSSAKAADVLAGTLEVVKGTPFPLDQFASAAQRLAGMGIEAQKIPTYLKAIGDAAATQGSNASQYLGQLTLVFGQIQAQGKLTGNDLMQLSQTGVNGLAILANHFNVTTGDMQKMISHGAVPAKDALDALTKGIEQGSDGIAGHTAALAGTMQALGTTVAGSFSNLRAAWARFGVAMEKPVFDRLPPLINAVSGAVDRLTAEIPALIDRFGGTEKITGIIDRLKAAFDGFSAKGLGDTLGALTSKLSAFGPIAAGAGTALATMGGRSIPILGQLLSNINPVVAALGAVAIASPQVRDALGDAFRQVMPVIQNVLGSLGPALSQIVGALAPALATIGGALGAALTRVAPAIQSALGALGPAISQLVTAAAPLIGVLGEALAQLVPPIATVVAAIAQALSPVLAALGPPLQQLAVTLGGVLAEAARALSPVIATIGQALAAILPPVLAVVQQLAEALVPVIEQIAPIIAENAAQFGQLVTALLPLIPSIGNLVAAFIPAIPSLLQLMTLGQQFLLAVVIPLLPPIVRLATLFFSALTPAIRFVADAMAKMSPKLQEAVEVFSRIGRVVGEFADKLINLLGRAWDSTRDKAEHTISYITGIPQRISDVALHMWDAIKDSFTTVKNWVGDRVGDIVGFVTGIPGRIGGVARTAFDAVRDGITNAKNWVSDRVNDMVGFITGLPGRLGDVGRAIANAITGAFKAAWNAVARTVNDIIPNSIHIGPVSIDLPDNPIPTLHTGGVVPGVPGEEVLALVQAGETVLTPAQVEALGRPAMAAPTGPQVTFQPGAIDARGLDPDATAELTSRRIAWRLSLAGRS